MSGSTPSLSASIYRLVAKLAARVLFASGAVESIALRRSAATGEVSFGRSDIDLLVVLHDDVMAAPLRLAKFYQRVRWVCRCFPRVKHLDVHRRAGLRSLAQLDTVWASMERRTIVTLSGDPIDIPNLPIDRDDAVTKFGLWLEWFVPLSVQRRDSRNIQKTALESWDLYAIAEGILAEPQLLRSEMKSHLRRAVPGVSIERLREPAFAMSFMFDLAARMQKRRLPPLKPLGKSIMFEVTMAPLSLRRLFVVVPRPDSPLPDAAFTKMAWPCTPESLQLYVAYTNPFLYWSLPTELIALGIELPDAEVFLWACRRYGHERFLTHPGFTTPGPLAQSARLHCVEQTLESILTGKPLKPVSEIRVDEQSGRPSDCLEYYRTAYSSLRRKSQHLQSMAASLPVRRRSSISSDG